METVLSVQLLQQPQADARPFAGWSARVRRGLGRRERPVFDLATPDDGTVPELLLAPTGARTLADGLTAVRSKPTAQAVSDLAVARSRRPDLPQWVVDVHHRRPAATSRLAALLDTYHRLAIAPTWRRVNDAFRAAFAGASAAEPERGLGGLHPSVSWDFPTLTVPCHIPHDVDVRLRGRGLVLIPVFFLRVPTARVDNYDERAPVELYIPVHQRFSAAGGDPYDDPGLTHLLGRTRAAVLTDLTDIRSTTELAARLGISASTASHHLNALREGGLITTVREHGAARHSLTHLGLRLLYRPARR
ncbi:winged helix-turn-helix domain-containing protein [Streptacidiphilus jiangxiensis]|nr:winged helix-turn-helix domain-containing protein [Streptacidiphilus jiangxiensis]